ncbi:MAG: transporter substrate-binding domain-containing protein [Chloroflexi bacterium]|nr:transporter substrate-binding domain-containing protein [Chloroflexota bacterium]
MKRFAVVLVFVMAFAWTACSSASSEAANLYEEIQNEGVIEVGTSADYAPFEYVDEDGNFVGFDMELIREIGDRLEVEIEIKDMSFDALIAAVQDGQVDLVIASMSPTAERDEQVDFSISYYTGTQSILGAADSGITISDPEQISDYTIGIQSGTTLDDFVTGQIEDGLLNEDNVMRYDRADNAALDLQAGRLDLVVIDTGPALALSENLGFEILLTDVLVDDPGTAIAIPEGETELKAALDEVIAELEAEGYIDQLIETWLYSQ